MLLGARVAGMWEEANTPQEVQILSAEVQQIGSQIARLEEAGSPTADLDAMRGDQAALLQRAQKLIDWQAVWALPAGLSALVLALFVAIFRERSAPA